MSNNKKIQFNIFGASHSESVGVSLVGVGFGEKIDLDELQAFVDRRKANASAYSTARTEPDKIIIESGIENGVTTGGEIVARILNTNMRKGDYAQHKVCPRPSHADYVSAVKYGVDRDFSGGGAFSGRMTAPMCIAGGIAIQILKRRGVEIGAYIQSIGNVNGKGYKFTIPNRDAVLSVHNDNFPLLDNSFKNAMEKQIERARADGDSCGGVVECCVFGLPCGYGNPLQESIESEISKNIFAIPGVKGIEFGSGFDISAMLGSQANDEFYFNEQGAIKTFSNHSGGINGGIANGMPITFRVAFRPVPSISKTQRTVNLETCENVQISIKGRHDGCFVPRAVPAVEAMAALSLINMEK